MVRLMPWPRRGTVCGPRFAGRILDRLEVPAPSRRRGRQRLVALDPPVAAQGGVVPGAGRGRVAQSGAGQAPRLRRDGGAPPARPAAALRNGSDRGRARGPRAVLRCGWTRPDRAPRPLLIPASPRMDSPMFPQAPGGAIRPLGYRARGVARSRACRRADKGTFIGSAVLAAAGGGDQAVQGGGVDGARDHDVADDEGRRAAYVERLARSMLRAIRVAISGVFMSASRRATSRPASAAKRSTFFPSACRVSASSPGEVPGICPGGAPPAPPATHRPRPGRGSGTP